MQNISIILSAHIQHNIHCQHNKNENLTMRSQSLETDLSRDPDPLSPKMSAGRMINVSHVASMRLKLPPPANAHVPVISPGNQIFQYFLLQSGSP